MFKKFFTLLKFSFYSIFFFFGSLGAEQKICIVIPAYNEATRIQNTLETYANYFKHKPEKTTFLVVANNCQDNTVAVTKAVAKKYKNIKYLDLKPGGKGFAVKEGFLWALKKDFDLIGFVDADMATLPQYYYNLIQATKGHDGAIASRYAQGAVITPKRPWGKKIGGKIYNWILRTLFDVSYKDTQCGAKIFTQDTIAKVAYDMHEIGWSFDLELLYLCKLAHKDIVEVPTTWSDQPGSHLTISSKIAKEFLNAPKRIKQRHQEKRYKFKEEKKLAKQKQKKEKKKSQRKNSL